MAAAEKDPPRFESLPPEIRMMIYEYLPRFTLQEVRTPLPVSYMSPQFHMTHILPEPNTAILCTNRNINKEASAVLYRDTLLVAIEWNTYDSAYLRLAKIPQEVAFNFILPGAPLPPCVVHVRQRFHDKNSGTATTSTVVDAADFPAICRLLLKPYKVPRYYSCGRRTSYSVISLPKLGYKEDKLRELIWLPLLALREGRWLDFWGKYHRNLRTVDCTGVFEQTAAVLDWDSEPDDGSITHQEDKNGESTGYNHGSDTEICGEEDSDEEDRNGKDSGEGDSGEEESDKDGIADGYSDDEDSGVEESGQGGDGKEEDSHESCDSDGGEGEIEDEEVGSDEATSKGAHSMDSEGMVPNSASSP